MLFLVVPGSSQEIYFSASVCISVGRDILSVSPDALDGLRFSLARACSRTFQDTNFPNSSDQLLDFNLYLIWQMELQDYF